MKKHLLYCAAAIFAAAFLFVYARKHPVPTKETAMLQSKTGSKTIKLEAVAHVSLPQ